MYVIFASLSIVWNRPLGRGFNGSPHMPFELVFSIVRPTIRSLFFIMGQTRHIFLFMLMTSYLRLLRPLFYNTLLHLSVASLPWLTYDHLIIYRGLKSDAQLHAYFFPIKNMQQRHYDKLILKSDAQLHAYFFPRKNMPQRHYDRLICLIAIPPGLLLTLIVS